MSNQQWTLSPDILQIAPTHLFNAMIKTTKTIQTTLGPVEIPRADLISIGKLRYTFTPGANTVYSYTFDNSEVAVMSLGGPPTRSIIAAVADTAPQGWLTLPGAGGYYQSWKDPTYSKDAVYSVTSPLKPGLLPMYFQSDVWGITRAVNGGPQPAPWPGLPALTKTDDNITYAAATSITGNSRREFVIGPVFKAGVTKADVLAAVQQWIGYGFTFLQPLADGGAVADLKPPTDLERDIVQCLRGVMWS
jgi:hypothetical protein